MVALFRVQPRGALADGGAAADASDASLRAAGEPDDDLLTWRRCRRCQAQFDAAAGEPCRHHPARFECGGSDGGEGGGAGPFLRRHRGGAAAPCARDCEGRFPCCGARTQRNAADSAGCREAPAHIA